MAFQWLVNAAGFCLRTTLDGLIEGETRIRWDIVAPVDRPMLVRLSRMTNSNPHKWITIN